MCAAAALHSTGQPRSLAAVSCCWLAVLIDSRIHLSFQPELRGFRFVNASLALDVGANAVTVDDCEFSRNTGVGSVGARLPASVRTLSAPLPSRLPMLSSLAARSSFAAFA